MALPSPALRVRAATPADRPFVLALVPELLAFGPPAWRRPEQMLETDALVIGRVLDGQSEGASLLIAEGADGTRLGFVHVCGEYDYYSRRECGHVADLVVAREGRGGGVGNALLDASEAWARARGHALLSLNVFVENGRARALYERAGFLPETVRYLKPL